MSKTGFIARGQAHAEQFIRHGVETWEAEDRIDHERAEQLMGTLDAPEVESGMLHLGAHFAISLPLRFPFGAMARFFYTLALRLRAEFSALTRRGSAKAARRMHTPLVMLVSMLPGFGRLGYFFSPALREERLLLVIPLDQVSRRLPFKAYARMHLDALFLYWGLGPERPQRRRSPDRTPIRVVLTRISELRPYLRVTLLVLALDSVLLFVGAYLFLDSGQQTSPPIWWFREGGLMAIANTGQLMVGAGFGIAAYVAFWRMHRGANREDAAGIFFWAIGGIGLTIFALDDFLTVHERFGDWLFTQLSFLPVVTEASGDMLIISYSVVGLAAMYLFRVEVFSNRPSSTLLQLAAAACVLMVLVDGFARTDALEVLEFPFQTIACSLLMLAFAVRWLEVSRPAGAQSGMDLYQVRNQQCCN